MLAKLSNLLVADAMRIAGMQDLGPVAFLPLATGMAITVTLLALKAARPATARWGSCSAVDHMQRFGIPAGPAQHHLLCFPAPALLGATPGCCCPSQQASTGGCRWVLWPRIDQKTCLKAIVSAGLGVVVVPMLREGDQLRTDLQAVRHHIERLGPDNIVAVVSTTSCFAPRSADGVVELARLAASAGKGNCRCYPAAGLAGAEQGGLHLLLSAAHA